MKNFLLGILFLASVANAETLTVPVPSADKSIPANLDQCFVHLKKAIGPVQVKAFKEKYDDNLLEYQSVLGAWVKRNWLTSADSPLAKYFQGRGINNIDNMSAIVIEGFHHHLTGHPEILETQIHNFAAEERSPHK